MPTTTDEILVRSKRKDNRFYIDNEFLNGYAKKVSWQGQVVYMALCRHEKEGKAFPGQIHLAKELDISAGSVSMGVKALVSWNIIKVERVGSSGRYIFWLLDRSEWKNVPKKEWSNQSKSLS